MQGWPLRMWFDRFGNWPPRNTGSFTYRMWTSKMIVPGMRRGNPVKKMSPEFKKKMNEQVRKVMQQFKEIQEQIKG
jgi:predicted transcriptional regulator